MSDSIVEETRDQGLNRAKVLILCPFRKYAYDIVQTMLEQLYKGKETFVQNLQKFEEEFCDDGNRIHKERKVSDEYKVLYFYRTVLVLALIIR